MSTRTLFHCQVSFTHAGLPFKVMICLLNFPANGLVPVIPLVVVYCPTHLCIFMNRIAVLGCAVCASHSVYFEEIRVFPACRCTEHISMEYRIRIAAVFNWFLELR